MNPESPINDNVEAAGTTTPDAPAKPTDGSRAAWAALREGPRRHPSLIGKHGPAIATIASQAGAHGDTISALCSVMIHMAAQLQILTQAIQGTRNLAERTEGQGLALFGINLTLFQALISQGAMSYDVAKVIAEGADRILPADVHPAAHESIAAFLSGLPKS